MWVRLRPRMGIRRMCTHGWASKQFGFALEERTFLALANIGRDRIPKPPG